MITACDAVPPGQTGLNGHTRARRKRGAPMITGLAGARRDNLDERGTRGAGAKAGRLGQRQWPLVARAAVF
jgi:hypothetical protein